MSNIHTRTSDVMTNDGLESVVHTWLDRLRTRGGASEATIRSYTSIMRSLTAHIHPRPVLYVTEEEIGTWLDRLAAEGREPNTRRVYLGVVAQFFLWCVRQHLRDDDPTLDLDRPKCVRRQPRPMPEDVAEMVMQCTADAEMKVIMALGIFGGCRACEVAGLDWREVDLDAERPYLDVLGKGRKMRRIWISGPLLEALTALPHRKGPVIRRLDGRPGQNSAARISHRASEHLEGLGVDPKWKLHTTRHRCATAMLRATGGNLRAVQEALGHSDPSTTAIYTKVESAEVGDAFLAAGQLHVGRRRTGRGPAQRSCRKPHATGAAS